jgi:LmbE family N-acetylglucosaminyl deacetylase
MQPAFDRTLVIAPHPDDEAIAAGGLIQRALSQGGAVRVVFVTDGENNPWPLRYMKRKWRITAAERREWGAMRRTEALASLRTLGARDDDALFLGYRDGALAAIARAGDQRPLEELRGIVETFEPTIIVSPSFFDLHSDHRAIAWYIHSAAPDREILTYVIHGRGPVERRSLHLDLTAEEAARKRAAIENHQSQLLLGRGRFLSYAGKAERFYRAEHDAMRIGSRAQEWRCKVVHAARVAMNRGAE